MKRVKPILLVVPTTMELSVLAPRPHDLLDTLVIGVGPVEAAIGLTMNLQARKSLPELLILAGICGVYRGEGHIEIGDVVMARSETFGDMGRCSMNDIHDMVIDGTPLSSTLRAYPTESLPLIGPGLCKFPPKEADMATVMCTSASFERAEIIRSRTGAQCENMEGASFFMAANALGLPFLEIRAVSNVVGESREDWKIEPALRALKTYLEVLVG